MAGFEQNFTEEIHALADQMKGLVNAIDGLAIILDHMDRNRDDVRYAAYRVVEPQESPESDSTVTSCFTCDNSTDTLAEAVQMGWKDFQHEPSGLIWCYLAQCTDCQKAEQVETAIATNKPATTTKAKPRELF